MTYDIGYDAIYEMIRYDMIYDVVFINCNWVPPLPGGTGR